MDDNEQSPDNDSVNGEVDCPSDNDFLVIAELDQQSWPMCSHGLVTSIIAHECHNLDYLLT